MKFTVTYRKQDGSLAKEVIDAADRAAALAAFRERGIVPQSVTEGGRIDSPSRRPAWLKGAIAGIAVVVIAFAAWFLLAPKPQPLPTPSPVPRKYVEPKPESTQKLRPKPVVEQTNRVPEVAKNPKKKTREEKIKAIEDRYRGREDQMPPGTKQALYYLKNPPQRTFNVAGRTARMFKRNSDRAIATLLTVEPGALFLEKPTYGESFLKDFRASLSEPIEISEDDSPEDAELKRAVQATRDEFKSRLEKGEDICATMNEVSASMYEMGQLKGDIEEQLNKMRLDENYTDQDIADFVTAANRLLRQKGIKEMPMPKLILRRYSLKKAAERAAQKAAEEAAAAQTAPTAM